MIVLLSGRTKGFFVTQYRHAVQTTVMEISVLLTTEANAHIIKNLWPLYVHDLSDFSADVPNKHGVYEDDAEAETYDHAKMLGVWWKKPGILLPFLILADGLPAGFCLIASPPHVPPEVDYIVNEFFLARPYRHKSVGDAAVAAVFGRLPGRWEVMVLPDNRPAQCFWRRAISGLTAGAYAEEFTETMFGPGYQFRFTAAAENTLSDRHKAERPAA